MNIISSVQNPKIKYILKLIEKSRERKKNNQFIVEGIQENLFALKNNFIPIDFFIQKDIFNNSFEIDETINITFVESNVYQKIAFRKSTEGIIGIYNINTEQNNIILNENSTILIIEEIEKPGNLGAIARTCEAFNIDLLIICDPLLDVFNPNVIRSSVGTIFSIPIKIMTKNDCYDFCIKNNIKIYSSFMNKKFIPLWELYTKNKTALLFGAEHNGISNFWEDKINDNFLIPMFGTVDSLNLSNSIAISLYEITKQKKQ